ncbi:MAG: ABC transporter substrate-binding protein [Thermomicrobiales bacterium]
MTRIINATIHRRMLLKGSLAAGAAATIGASAASAAPTAQESGGELIYAQNMPITTPDPINPQTYPAAYEANYTIYRNLVTFDRDLAIMPDLAESWERAEDGLTWTFTLRQGVTFHDGTPFNAQAVAAHIARIQDPATASPNANLWAHITGVEVVDDATIQLITAQPFGAMLTYLAHGSGGIESPTAVQEYGAEYAQHPTGAGPYKLESFSPGTELVLTRFDDFYGGPPSLDKITMRAVPEVGSRVLLLDAGEAHVANDVPPEEADRLANGDTTQLLRQAGLRTFWMEFNLNREIFQDVNVRRALNHAVNTQSIVDNLFLGYATALDSPAAPSIQGHVTAGAYAYDPDLAKQMLTEAGWTAGDDGILEKDGVPLTFTINTAEGEYPKDIQVVEAVQADLKAVGCDVEIWKVEAAARWDYLRLPIAEAEYDMVLFGFNPSNGDIGYHLNSLFRSNSDQSAAPNVWNLMWYSNPQVDELLNEADRTVDEAARFDLLGQAQQLIWDDAPMIWLYAPEMLGATTKDVTDVYIWPTIFTVVRDASAV